MAQITNEKVEYRTPWFELVSKTIAGHTSPFYSLRMTDYVCVVALTEAQQLILVRQFRPAIERSTLELPSGHVERGEAPEAAARRELLEECGFESEPVLLGKLVSDSGRNENRCWCFLVRNARPAANFKPETDVQPVLVPAKELAALTHQGDFDHAPHIAALWLAAGKLGPSVFGMTS